VSTTVAAPFVWSLGADAALLPRTVAIADAYHQLIVDNHRHLARWEPWAAERPTPEGTRAYLDSCGWGWLEGTQIPTAIAVPADDDRWQLVGSAGLRIDTYRRAGELGYWIAERFEGRGLVTRAASALIEHGFGALGLGRIALRTDIGNHRSRAVADRLGFTEEGVERGALVFGDERRDDVVFGLLAEEWQPRRHNR
jgi:ribosomal-protein-serine acetyltransferase